VDGARNVFLSVKYRSGLRFEVPGNGEIQGKCVVGLAEGTHCPMPRERVDMSRCTV